MKLIDKDALVAEIERRNKEAYGNEWGWAVKCETYSEILSILDTLEVKEVDLEKEIDDAFLENKCNITDNVSLGEFVRIAKHFFELGLKAQKGKEV